MEPAVKVVNCWMFHSLAPQDWDWRLKLGRARVRGKRMQKSKIFIVVGFESTEVKVYKVERCLVGRD